MSKQFHRETMSYFEKAKEEDDKTTQRGGRGRKKNSNGGLPKREETKNVYAISMAEAFRGKEQFHNTATGHHLN